MTPEELKNNLEYIRLDMDIEINEKSIDSVQEKLSRITLLVGLSAECVAAAKRYHLNAQLAALKKHLGSGLQPSLMNKMVDAECAKESETFLYAERLNAGITHIQDSLRTIISLYKTELQNQLK